MNIQGVCTMIGKQHSNKVVKAFFLDWYIYLVGVFLVFAVALVLACYWNGWGLGCCAIIFGWLLLMCMSFRMVALHIKVIKEIRSGNICEEKTIVIAIDNEPKLGFRNNGGAPIGDERFWIIGDNGNKYIMKKRASIPWMDINALVGCSLVVHYLPESRFVLKLGFTDDTIYNKRNRKKYLRIIRALGDYVK